MSNGDSSDIFIIYLFRKKNAFWSDHHDTYGANGLITLKNFTKDGNTLHYGGDPQVKLLPLLIELVDIIGTACICVVLWWCIVI